MNHEAIRKVYPNAVSIDDGAGAFDLNGNKIELDQVLIDAATLIVARENERKQAENGRRNAYLLEADPLFFKSQRGEVSVEEWKSKILEIKNRFPYTQDVIPPVPPA